MKRDEQEWAEVHQRVFQHGAGVNGNARCVQERGGTLNAVCKTPSRRDVKSPPSMRPSSVLSGCSRTWSQ